MNLIPKRIELAFLLFFLLALIPSCKKDVTRDNISNRYFPLGLNNSWLYKDNNNHYYFFRETDGDSIFNGKAYAYISSYDSTMHHDNGEILLRSENDEVYIYHVNYVFSDCFSAPTEQKLLKGNAAIGETWDSYANCSKCTVIKIDTAITIGSFVFSNVIQIHEEGYDTLHSYPRDSYYAKDVGLILVTGSTYWQLCDYKIN